VLGSLAPARRRLVLVVFAVALLVCGLVAARWATGRARPAAVAQDVPGPILLIPGYGGSTSALESLASSLRATGRAATVVSLPDGAVGDLSAQAAALGGAVHVALGHAGAKSVDVVGYSAGGVVARLWAREHGGARLARRIVSLGAPQHGTELAAAGSSVPGACPTACQQLVPNSTLLDRLNAGDETPAGPVFVSIWTQDDQVVQPPDSARLGGGTNIVVQDVCPASTVGHGQLPTDPLVQAMVRAELTADAVRTFSRSDCQSLSS
jgi:triacylglycerol lipase